MLKVRNFNSLEVFSPFNLKIFIILTISLNFLWLVFFFIFYKKLSFIDKLEEYSTIFKGIFLGIIIIYSLSFLMKPSVAAISWEMLGLYWLLTYIIVMAGKWFIHLIQIKLYLKNDVVINALIIGTTEKVEDILETIVNFPYLNYNILSVIKNEINSKKYFKNMEMLDEIINRYKIEEIIIALDKSDELLIENLYNYFIKKKIRISYRSDLYKFASGLAKITSVPGLPIINLDPFILNKEQKIIKRAFDIFFSLLVLTITLA